MKCPLCGQRLTKINRLTEIDGISTPTNNYSEICQTTTCQMFVKLPENWRIREPVQCVGIPFSKTNTTKSIVRGSAEQPTP